MKKVKWTKEEDELLRKYALQYNEKNWRKISENVPGRNLIQCFQRWNRCLKPDLAKGPWKNSEDKKLLEWVRENGVGNWALVAKHIQGRTTEQCRDRWFNVLSPDIKKGEWTKEEDEILLRSFKKFGSSWNLIANFIPGRTQHAVKHRYHSILRNLSKLPKDKANAPLLGANEFQEKEGKVQLIHLQQQISLSLEASNVPDISEETLQDKSGQEKNFEKELPKEPENSTSPCFQNHILESIPNSAQGNIEIDFFKYSRSTEQRQHYLQKQESLISYNHLFFEKASSAVQIFTNALSFPSKIIKECFSKTLNGAPLLDYLTKLLDSFGNLEIDTLILVTEELAVKSGIPQKVFDLEMIKQLTLEMSEALNYASQLHYDYSKNLFEQYTNGSKERPKYLFSELSLLQKVIAKVMTQMANLQEYSYVENENLIEHKQAVKIEESIKEEDLSSESFVRPSVAIKSDNFNSRLEQMTKKRILG